MRKFVIMIVCCLSMSIISQRRSESVNRRKYTEREQLFFLILTCYMTVFAGLRTNYNDTIAYFRNFSNVATFPAVLTNMDWALGSNPGYDIYLSIIKTFANNKQIFLLISSAFVLFVHMWFIRKHSCSFPFSLFLFFMLGYYAFTMAAIKQTMGTAFALIGLDFLLRGKKVPYVLFVLLGMLFHPYAFLFFLAPILMKQIPWRSGTWTLIILTLIASYSFNFLLGTILDITDVLGEEYDSTTFVGDGINVFRVIVYFVPVFISFFGRRTLFLHSTKTENLFVNCSIVSALIMFVGLFGNATMFSRLAVYFDPLNFLTIPWMLYKLRGEMSGRLLTVGAYGAYSCFFYFDNVIMASFEYNFSSITLWQFINSIFN